jgi:trimeric autotransporter adhesin
MKTSSLRPIVLAVAIACVSLPLAAQSSYALNRVVAPIDETSLVPLRGNLHPLAQARYDRGPAPEGTPTGRIMLMLQRSASQQQALTQYLADLQNPSSPSYHKWLTPAQYGALYSISDADLQTVEGWLQGHGFKIEKVPQARNVIEFSGDFAQLQSAFHTTIHSLFVNGENHFANMTDPEIPAALAPVIAGVGPLNDFRPKPPLVTGPRGHYDAARKRIVPGYSYGCGPGAECLLLVPADAATIYDTPNSWNVNFTGATAYTGSGVNIGIVGISDLNWNDVENYRTAFLGETTANVNLPTQIIDGNDPGLVLDWSVEGLLDNEVAGGLAPKAKIYFYESGGSDLTDPILDAAYRAIDDNTVSILSMSVQYCEEGLGSENASAYESEQQAAAQGISVIVAAGDSGSAGCDNFDTETAAQYGFNVNGWASPPYAVAVGGTDFDGLEAAFPTYAGSGFGNPGNYGSVLKYIPENPWNDSTTVNTTLSNNLPNGSAGETNIVAGSGGFSSCSSQDTSGDCLGGYAVPAFQAGITPSGGVTNSNGVRMIPDVAFFAGDGYYYTAWAICSDPTSDGSTESYTDCVNTNGTLADGTQVGGVGGTSAAAPAFAGMLALVAQANGSASDNYRLGAVDPVLYSLAANSTTYASAFHDVTVGNNSVVCTGGSAADCGSNGFMQGYNAGTNYDLASGLGSVDVQQLANDWGDVSFAATTTTLNLNGSTAAYTGTHGTNVTFNVGVTPTTANGSAAVIDTADQTSGGTTAGPQNNGQFAVALTSGAASATYNGLPGGQYTVYARYGGDTVNGASKSTPISVNISAENSSTILQVDAYDALSGNSLTTTTIPYGDPIHLDAYIDGTNADEANNNTQGVATGTITFSNSGTVLGTASLATGNYVSNIASWPPLGSKFTVLPAGSYSVTAAYSGDASFKNSTSSATSFTVSQETTTTAASASPTSISSSATSTVSLTITTPYSDAVIGEGALPTGMVTLTGNSATLATVNLSSFSGALQSSSPYNYVLTGTATVQGSALATGSNTITATYSGDANYTGSNTSIAVTVTGSSSSGSIALSSNPTSLTVDAGNTGTSTISVTPGGGFTGAVNLTCAVTTSIVNPNDPPTCTVPSSVTVSGTAAATATMSIGTVATTGGSVLVDPPLGKFFLGGGATLAMLFFFGLPARRRAWRGVLSVVAILFVAGAIGCGGGGGSKTIPGTTPGTYTATVTGADAATGKITGNIAVTINVNQLAP